MLSKDEIIERLDDVFRDVFDDDTLEVGEIGIIEQRGK